MEHKLFEGSVPYVSTAKFHADRERAPHLEQAWHRPRLERAAEFVRQAVAAHGDAFVTDLGCGDGGLLSLVQNAPGVRDAWGYDFAPANTAGWAERGVTARQADVFGADWGNVNIGDVAIMTEVLEHLADPHGVLVRLHRPESPRYLVCSSPWNENQNNHCAEHAWAWDLEGYAAMIESAGWTIQRHEQVGLFQVVLAH
jgi:2-polyprenyl-3-methyl-5-hydroxy-6-metoxy-1,4-benzoquinol methylase